MAAFKNKANGTWYVQFRYTDWKGVGTGVSDAKAGRCEHDL